MGQHRRRGGEIHRLEPERRTDGPGPGQGQQPRARRRRDQRAEPGVPERALEAGDGRGVVDAVRVRAGKVRRGWGSRAAGGGGAGGGAVPGRARRRPRARVFPRPVCFRSSPDAVRGSPPSDAEAEVLSVRRWAQSC